MDSLVMHKIKTSDAYGTPMSTTVSAVVTIVFSNTIRAERSERPTPYDTNKCPADMRAEYWPMHVVQFPKRGYAGFAALSQRSALIPTAHRPPLRPIDDGAHALGAGAGRRRVHAVRDHAGAGPQRLAVAVGLARDRIVVPAPRGRAVGAAVALRVMRLLGADDAEREELGVTQRHPDLQRRLAPEDVNYWS